MICPPLQSLFTTALVAGSLFCSIAAAQVTGPVDSLPTIDSAAVVDSPVTPSTVANDKTATDKGVTKYKDLAGSLDERIEQLLIQMTLDEKIGQLIQVYPSDVKLSDGLAGQIRAGQIGSIFYPGKASIVNEAKAISINESRLGIPLIIARDVIHGFRTIFPIPLGQAASWNPELVEQAAVISSQEAKGEQIDWTFAPMIDICRDARWGRIAETMGEDTYLASELGNAMVRGFQQEKAGIIEGIAACAKHYVAYGLAEGGRDYNRASVSDSELRNVFLPPFKSAIEAGCRTLMTTFSEVNGIPGTAHDVLLNQVLKGEWDFSGMVVSDWGSITEMVVHGYCKNDADAAEVAMNAGVDMDMCSKAYPEHLKRLIQNVKVSEEKLDDAVRRVLRLKMELNLDGQENDDYALLQDENLAVARQLASESVVLLKNDKILPLKINKLKKLAIIGPMAHEPVQQLGCWSLDGKPENSITPLTDMMSRLAGKVEVVYSKGVKNTFSNSTNQIAEAVRIAKDADVAVLYIGEGAVLSGEARSRSDLCLPGAQAELVEAVVETGTPVVLVYLSGRPLALKEQIESAKAVLFGWHPGTMTGAAIGDLLFGDEVPSGKLPVTFPRTVGQIPLYYNHTNTGRPNSDDYTPLFQTELDDLPPAQLYRSHYLDIQPTPLFPFGYGLSYSQFEYSDIELESSQLRESDEISVSARLTNTGKFKATEVVQVYMRDRNARVIRPVRELKAFRRVELSAKESKIVSFTLPVSHLSFYNNEGKLIAASGKFDIWVGGDSRATLGTKFDVVNDEEKMSNTWQAAKDLGDQSKDPALK